MPSSQTNGIGAGRPPKARIVILGGGFGGLTTARHVERLFKLRKDVEIILVSRDNFLVMTPLLFEVCSGALDALHCSFPIRAFLRTTRFVEAQVQGVDLERRVVHLCGGREPGELAYNQLVIAPGGLTNRRMIPGSKNTFAFKTLADAFLLRNHVIERFERADVESDAARKGRQLTFLVIGGGLVGVELFGEPTAFADGIAPLNKHVARDEVRFILLEAGSRIMPEIDPTLADYRTEVLRKRRGADIRAGASVLGIPGGLSFLVTGGFSRPLPGLNDFPEKDRPLVMMPFVSYHLMAGVYRRSRRIRSWASSCSGAAPCSRAPRILAGRYGIGGTPEITLAKFGLKLGISKERVRQIEARVNSEPRNFPCPEGLETLEI